MRFAQGWEFFGNLPRVVDYFCLVWEDDIFLTNGWKYGHKENQSYTLFPSQRTSMDPSKMMVSKKNLLSTM